MKESCYLYQPVVALDRFRFSGSLVARCDARKGVGNRPHTPASLKQRELHCGIA